MALPDKKPDNFNHIKITRDTNPGAQFTVIYGKGDVGKTATAIYSPEPVIIPVGTERCHRKFPAFKIENIDNTPPLVHLFDAMQYLITQEHSRKTVIIDNLSTFRAITESDVVDTYPVNKEGKKAKGIGDYGYGKGQAYAFGYYARLLDGIDALLNKGIHVILIAHEAQHTINLPNDTYYQETGIYAPTGDKTNVKGLLEAKANNILYLRTEANVRKSSNAMQEKSRMATLAPISRVIYTRQTGLFFAKTKSALPDYIEVEQSENFDDLASLKNPTLKYLFEELYK
jgi:hypothetical protein